MSVKCPPQPMTAAEIVEHPEFPHVNWDLEPEKKGKVAVARGRGGPINIAYEIHGCGDARLVWIMGLGGLKSTWQRQTKDFGHTQAEKYSCLIFDNRGVGASDKPILRYSTSEMAKDTIELVDSVGWTGHRQLHVIGVSMGGMIAQEMALLIPERIASLTLVSTAAGLFNTVGFWENLRHRVNLFVPHPIDVQLANIKRNVFTEPWLTAPDEAEYTTKPFPTNGDRWAAAEITKRRDKEAFPRTGFMAQAVAANWHRKTPTQLKEMADLIGRERIQLVHGGKDCMISFPHALKLLEGLGGEESGVTKHFDMEQGHVIPIEMRKQFNGWVEALVSKAMKLNETGE